jgi:hypothetical protein
MVHHICFININVHIILLIIYSNNNGLVVIYKYELVMITVITIICTNASIYLNAK